jgi:hypothetical protein
MTRPGWARSPIRLTRHLTRSNISVERMVCVRRFATGCGAWLVLAVLLTRCASAPTRLEGDAGPVVWRVADIEVIKRDTDDAYVAKLIIKEARRATITFTRYELTVSDFNLAPGAPAVYTGRWVLRPNTELTLNLSHSVACPPFPGGCGSPLRTSAPEFHIRLTGTTSEGEAVNVTITTALPPAQLRIRNQ